MCGIAGYWGNGNRDILQGMGDSLTHRGPDDGGILEIDSVGLAHRRLSIVDLSPLGHQPMTSRDGSISLVFNGEIYNYKELKEKFLSAETLRGSSDTEVLLSLYEVLGEKFLKEVQGMFALALYDRRTRQLLLARDHMGKKPLFWTLHEGTFIFGSELKALRVHPECPREFSKSAIAEYLVFEYIKSPRTIYADIFKLEPGTYLTYDGKSIQQASFSALESNLGTYEGSYKDAVKELYTHIENAVQKRMVADVPVGVFLSGGLDSSTVAYFAQKSSSQNVQTFSIGFEDASFDESAYAREVALYLGTEHHERTVGPKDLLSVLESIPRVLDEPMADSSIIPTLLLSEFTSETVKVSLGGDGADELFFGYDTFRAKMLADIYGYVPHVIRRGVRTVVEKLPVSHEYMSFDFKAKKFLSGFDALHSRRNAYWLSAFTPLELSSILTFDAKEQSIFVSVDALYGASQNEWDGLQMDYLKGYLAEEILVKTDRAGMAHGLEVRAPFLDINLVNFALTLPVKYKQNGMTGKYILKDMMKDKLPGDIVSRKKKGFNIPIGMWIRTDLKDIFTATILDGALVSSGLFKREGLAILLQAHQNGTVDNRKKLWTLFVLALWMEEWMKGSER
jgi:asparagine synthase (glutamine-hydrolysing)